MAKKISITAEKQYLGRMDSYARQVDLIYQQAIREATALGLSISDYDPTKPFTWRRYPQTKARVDTLINKLYSSILVTINDATRNEWFAASVANDAIVDRFFKSKKLHSFKFDRYYQRNVDALESFQIRKTKGLNLSQRIWNSSIQLRNDLEMCLDVGLADGRSASELSRDIRQYLNEPDKLYRRIRNKDTGNYYLSKNAEKYNPKAGQYRSSYKNAMRLARTEPNMAYRESDIHRWKQLDFVVGYEVKRSNNVYSCPVCNALAGRYPKSFKFNGWHPQCRCYIVSILATPDEFIAYQKKLLAGNTTSSLHSKNEIKELPPNFKDWVRDNSQKIAKAKNAPYFLQDNFSKKDISKGLKVAF